MNGKKAKKLRRMVYGLTPIEREYESINTIKKVLIKKVDPNDPNKNIYAQIKKTTIKNSDGTLRNLYQKLKTYK